MLFMAICLKNIKLSCKINEFFLIFLEKGNLFLLMNCNLRLKTRFVNKTKTLDYQLYAHLNCQNQGAIVC